MTDKEVYTQAAMKLTRNLYFSCNAIYHPRIKNNLGTVAQRNRYREVFGFGPDLDAEGNWLLHDDSFINAFPGNITEGLRLRVLCLLMMAAACDDI